MDSHNPCSQTSNFMDLLNSQQDREIPETSQFSFSEPTPVRSEDIPLFSSQPAGDKQEERKERKRWSKSEDITLISSWLNTSKDSIVSNEQKTNAFWNRIAAWYNASPTIPADEKRESNHCKQRWRKINDHVSKFCGAYAAANSPPKSGFGPKEYLALAHEIFLSDYKVKFMLEHAWDKLKIEQKWCQINSQGVGGGNSKRRKTTDGGAAQSDSSQSVNNLQDGAGGPQCDSSQSVEVRPPGVKAAKGKLKRSVTNPDIELEQAKKLETIQTVWEIKQKDAAIKAKQSEMGMLEGLLARTDQLSELEIALKNKLITNMLSKP